MRHQMTRSSVIQLSAERHRAEWTPQFACVITRVFAHAVTPDEIWKAIDGFVVLETNHIQTIGGPLAAVNSVLAGAQYRLRAGDTFAVAFDDDDSSGGIMVNIIYRV